MRTKTLLLTAALSAAGVAASMAQVYSVNVVGYVNVTVPANKLMLLANPLDNSGNTISTVLPLAETADGTSLFRFNTTSQSFKDALLYIGGLGWMNSGSGEVADDVLAPGEGFFIQAPPTVPLNLTFVGEVKQGSTTVPLAGGGRLNLIGSTVPQAINVGDVTMPNSMMMPAEDGDVLFLWNPAAQSYDDGYSYIGGIGWAQSDFDHPEGPAIPVGAGFWLSKAPTSAAANWTRTFNVQ